MVRLSAQGTGRLYTPGNIPCTHSSERLSQPQSHRAAARIFSIKNSGGIMRNRTRDVPAFRAVHQPTAPPRALFVYL